MQVILCGGPLKIPKLKSYIGNLFPHADIPNGISPDEVLAYGAAVQACFLAKYSNTDDDLPEPTTEVHILKESVEVEVSCFFPSFFIFSNIIFQLLGEILNFDQNEILPSTKSIKTVADVNNIILKATSKSDKINMFEVNYFYYKMYIFISSIF